ncbi:MAG: biotin--[acetyl-CoA-carboxylase] ligase [Caldilineaceae bacterium]
MQLDLERLTHELKHAPVGHTIDYQHSIPSTMPVAHQLALLPTTRSGAIVVAEEQTAGRGRLERRWEAPLGEAVLVSMILKQPFPIEPLTLPLLAGVATADALLQAVPGLAGQVGLKWPNDVLLGNTIHQAQKVAGILLESTLQGGEIQHVILGIGINVNQTVATLPPVPPTAPTPTSLRLFTGQILDRTAILIALCQSLGQWLTASSQQLTATWRSRLWTLGQAVNVHEAGESNRVFQGRAVDVTPEGSLIVEDDNGVQRIFAAGDVSLRAY